jgi:hypothetical protein
MSTQNSLNKIRESLLMSKAELARMVAALILMDTGPGVTIDPITADQICRMEITKAQIPHLG